MIDGLVDQLERIVFIIERKVIYQRSGEKKFRYIVKANLSVDEGTSESAALRKWAEENMPSTLVNGPENDAHSLMAAVITTPELRVHKVTSYSYPMKWID